MFPPLPEERARFFCTRLLTALKEKIPTDAIRIGHDFVFSSDTVPAGGESNSVGIGREMFGVLVCTDKDGNEVVLKGFSGKLQGRWLVTGWVPPLFDVSLFDRALSINDAAIHELTVRLAGESDPVVRAELKKKRQKLTDESLSAVYRLYRFVCIDGSSNVFRDFNLKKKPPTGTGDCCEPKLLDFAFRNGLHPVSMAEFLYDDTVSAPLRETFCVPCDERCALVLPQMLGLSIVYRDDVLIVVNKQAGLLSVPGRGENHQDCVVSRVCRLFPFCIPQPSVHRLDQDTSGLLVLAFTAEAHRNLSLQFQRGEVRKKYIALLEGKLEESCGQAVVPGQNGGRMELPFRLDPDNRPHQVYDDRQGKIGITVWKKIKEQRISKNEQVLIRTRVEFTPLTGRTHQLRLAAADRHGLGIPIAGDRLYGTRKNDERLMLHACYLEFAHPVTGKIMVFRSEPDF